MSLNVLVQANMVQHHRFVQPGVISIQFAGLFAAGFVHQSGDKASLRIASTVIETKGRKGNGQFRAMAHAQAGAIENGNAGILGKNQVTGIGQCQRTDP